MSDNLLMSHVVQGKGSKSDIMKKEKVFEENDNFYLFTEKKRSDNQGVVASPTTLVSNTNFGALQSKFYKGVKNSFGSREKEV
jgi:hypothetical protein